MIAKEKLKRIAVFTSGGDAPGMNAAVRAVTRAALSNNIEVYGIKRGYQGMIEDEFIPLNSSDVSNIIQNGGTFLQTARSQEFMTREGRIKAHKNLLKHAIDALVVIGGDGSFTGALVFSDEFGIPVAGIPGTIDNDMFGTDYTIGFDTALNTVVQAVDKLKDTANSHGRLFFVEVMGREAGALALKAGIACGAEVTFIPEIKGEMKDLYRFLEKDYNRKKRSGIIMVAEGDRPGGAFGIADKVREDFPNIDVRVTILGHVQRGGNPSAADRYAATQMGIAAVDALLEGKINIMAGLQNGRISFVPLYQVVKTHHHVDHEMLRIQKIINEPDFFDKR